MKNKYNDIKYYIYINTSILKNESNYGKYYR